MIEETHLNAQFNLPEGKLNVIFSPNLMLHTQDFLAFRGHTDLKACQDRLVMVPREIQEVERRAISVHLVTSRKVFKAFLARGDVKER